MANEKRLIDANALLEKVQFRMDIDNQTAEIFALCVDITRRLIENAPTVDAVEVVHGRWTPLVKNGFSFGVTCSECNTTWDDKSNYCPNCGADMREREDDGK